jgi:hypothetical protein
MEMTKSPSVKPLVWIGSTRSDLASFPEDVKRSGRRADSKRFRAQGDAGDVETKTAAPNSSFWFLERRQSIGIERQTNGPSSVGEGIAGKTDLPGTLEG